MNIYVCTVIYKKNTFEDTQCWWWWGGRVHIYPIVVLCTFIGNGVPILFKIIFVVLFFLDIVFIIYLDSACLDVCIENDMYLEKKNKMNESKRVVFFIFAKEKKHICSCYAPSKVCIVIFRSIDPSIHLHASSANTVVEYWRHAKKIYKVSRKFGSFCKASAASRILRAPRPCLLPKIL